MMKKATIILLTLFISLGAVSFAQDLNEAGETFNEAIQFTKDENFTDALAAYQKTINICNQLGEEGMDLKMKAEQQMPSTYYNIAKAQYENKDYNDAIANFEMSATWADRMQEEKTANAARTYLAGIYTSIGNSDYKDEDYGKAIESYGKALAYKSDYLKAYYGMGLTYKKQDNLDAMKTAMDKVLSLAVPDDKTARKAREVVATTYLNEGALALQGGAYDKAVSNLGISIEYDAAEPLAHYYLALAYNGRSEYDSAIESANKAINAGLPNAGDAWFAIGQAYEAKGDAAEACKSYKMVTTGPNVEAAKYQVEQVLKCN